MKLIDLTGQCFGRLTVVRIDSIVDGQVRWRCKCACGKASVALANNLRRGKTQSCGCKKLENGTHFMSRTLTGRTWRQMLDRCYNSKHVKYHLYGGRGIGVCEFLRASPINLKLLIGERHKEHSIDRIDRNGNYTCGSCAECLRLGFRLNVRWSTILEQNRNRRCVHRVEWKGLVLCIPELATRLGMPGQRLYRQLLRGARSDAVLIPRDDY